MKKTRVIVTGLVMIFLAVSAGYAQGQGEKHQGWQGKKEGIFKELNLTPEQKKKLEENRTAQGEQTAKLRAAIKQEREKLQKELNNPDVTRAAVEPLVKELKSLDAKLIDNRINGIFAVKAILTPEQFVKFNQIMEKQMRDRKGRPKDSREKPKGQTPEME
jgi:Spy/CpxP family protein refolding chaperone